MEKDTIFWDSELAGFGVRVHPTGRKVYIAQTRADGKAAKRVTVGRHGVITADEARRRADAGNPVDHVHTVYRDLDRDYGGG